MSSHIILHGYIEGLTSSESSQEESVSQHLPPPVHNADAVSPLMASLRKEVERCRGSIVPFGERLKKIGDDQCDEIQRDFESLLRSAPFASAHLSIDDEEGLGQRHLDYVFGPTKFGGPDRITRISHRWQQDDPEELE